MADAEKTDMVVVSPGFPPRIDDSYSIDRETLLRLEKEFRKRIDTAKQRLPYRIGMAVDEIDQMTPTIGKDYAVNGQGKSPSMEPYCVSWKDVKNANGKYVIVGTYDDDTYQIVLGIHSNVVTNIWLEFITAENYPPVFFRLSGDGPLPVRHLKSDGTNSDSMKEWSSWWYKRCGVVLPIKTTTGGPRNVIPGNRPTPQAVDCEYSERDGGCRSAKTGFHRVEPRSGVF
jgi:hypothetical protein